MTTYRSLIVVSLVLLGGPRDSRAQDRAAPRGEPTRPATSYALIDRALAAKEIGVEKAHVYRVFAAFADTRLPERYRGVDAGLDEPPSALTHAFRLLKTFSAQTQADLAPFFKRPASPGSWITLPTVRQPPSAVSPRDEDVSASLLQDAGSAAPNVFAADIAGAYPRATAQTEPAQASPWHTVRAAGGKVKVWAQIRYTGDSLKAEQIARELTSTIWRRLVGLFWEPLSDAHLDDNGGDGALDIYLVRADFGTSQPWKGRAEFADPVHVCGESPHYLLIDSRGAIGGATSVGILQTVAHELNHAITGRKPLKDFNCDEYVWIREATATWTEDWVYPRAQSEHETAQHFLRDPRLSLDHVSADETDKHHYGAYLLPFHLANHGQQLAIPAMWEQFGRHRSLDGIDAALRL